MTPSKIRKMFGISYLGSCSSSPKLIKSMNRNVLTYGIYLAPYDISGYNVCPKSDECRKYCLHAAGRHKLELLSKKNARKTIGPSRIKKTKMFFENRDLFMKLLCYEIDGAKMEAGVKGMTLAVRLNCTSDINIEKFAINGENILELYPDVQFYDYTKVYNYMKLAKKYSNYDLTFSYDGTNWAECETLLNLGHRVSVVFEDKKLPGTFLGYPVINANDYDARFLDAGGVICGLTYKKVANDYASGEYKKPVTPFITQSGDKRCSWA